MTIKKVYIGSIGPFEYDDSELIDDPDGDFAGENKQAVRSNGVVQGSAGAFVGGSSGSLAMITDIRFNSTLLEYKTRTVTVTNGCISALGTESAWTTVPTV
jgi:hypothetical protein